MQLSAFNLIVATIATLAIASPADPKVTWTVDPNQRKTDAVPPIFDCRMIATHGHGIVGVMPKDLIGKNFCYDKRHYVVCKAGPALMQQVPGGYVCEQGKIVKATFGNVVGGPENAYGNDYSAFEFFSNDPMSGIRGSSPR